MLSLSFNFLGFLGPVNPMGRKYFLFLYVLFYYLSCEFALCKECSNHIHPQVSSHGFRYELLKSNNETWKKEMFSHNHLTPTDSSAWGSLLPRNILMEEDETGWIMLYRKIKASSEFKVPGGLLKEVPLDNVRLDPSSMHGQAQQTNLEYLLMLDVDRLVWSFRKTAGLPTPGNAYGGWEASNCELRGHFVGHYLSASAQMWASTHNDSLKEKMFTVVSALSSCQNNMGTGYLSAFPSEQFDRFEALKPVWAPYYTIHKGDHRNLILAHLFDKPCFLGLLAVKADDISGFHANTHIPIVIGSQMRYEVTGDPLYKEIGIFFMDIVNSSYTYATGGTSFDEFWKDPKRLASFLGTENEESCTTYNMLKVSRHLFRWTKEMAYADYYERALTNGVLSIQRGKEPGVMIYMLPLGHGESKAQSENGWGTKFDSFWCCYGTGIESFSKLGDSIYFEEEGIVPEIYIIQYISSSFDWSSGKILLDMKVEPVVSWDNRLHVTVKISSKEQGAGQSSTLNFRTPFWAHSDAAKAVLNGQELSLPIPGNFLSITRKWSTNDMITLELPISIRTEAIQDDRLEYSSDHAMLYGPYLLVGLTVGDRNINAKAAGSLSDWITPIPASYNSHLITLSQESGNKAFVLANSNKSIKVGTLPEPGSNHSVYATFRLILKDSNSSKLSAAEDFIGKSVLLEPFDIPGMVVVQQGIDQSLGIADSSGSSNSVFLLVAGLDGKKKSVSLESERHRGCYVYSVRNLHVSVKLKCSSGSSDVGFKQAASFTLRDGISKYDPISFVVKGATRNFLLQPLVSLRDENYVVYFNIQSENVQMENLNSS